MAKKKKATNKGFIPVANTSDFKVWQWPSPGYIVLENEVIQYNDTPNIPNIGRSKKK